MAPADTLPLSGSTPWDLAKLLKEYGQSGLTAKLMAAGVTSPEGLCTADLDLLLDLGVVPVLIRRAGHQLNVPSTVAHISVPSVVSQPPAALRADHPPVRPGRRGDIAAALATTRTPEAREAA